MREGRARQHLLGLAVWLVTWLTAPATPAAGPPLMLVAERGVSADDSRRVRRLVRELRAVREPLAWPVNPGTPSRQAALEGRLRAIQLALERAHRRESEADFDGCVREAASVLSDATDVLALTDELAALRDLHVQIGVCLATAGSVSSARPHFLAAALLDESEPRIGLHRQEAELAQLAAREEVLERTRGLVRIETDPPGARVWVDGRPVSGVTPLETRVRLGDHFVTARRFRYEPQTTRVVLQPSGRVRIALEAARRDTLQSQLATQRGGQDPAEVRLARAQWSRAEQLLVLSRARGQLRLRLLELPLGRSVRKAELLTPASDEDLRLAVCRVLGEPCTKPTGGVPWYVWPLAGAVVVGGAVTTAVVLESNREFRYCPARGC